MEHHTTTSRAEAERLLGIAEKLLRNKDLAGARDFAKLALDTEPLLDGSDQILAVANVLVSAEKRVNNNNHHDWYSILQIDHRTDDSDLIKKQYRKLALLLHPDKNKFAFADSAFRLVSDAWNVLSDPTRKSAYDTQYSIYKVDLTTAATMRKPNQNQNQTTRKNAGGGEEKLPVRRSTRDRNANSNSSAGNDNSSGGGAGGRRSNLGSGNNNSNSGLRGERRINFWTTCPYCYNLYEYPRMYLGCCLKCQNCERAFTGIEVPSMPPRVPGKDAYYCCWGFFPMGFVAGDPDGEVNAADVSGFPNWMPPMFPGGVGVGAGAGGGGGGGGGGVGGGGSGVGGSGGGGSGNQGVGPSVQVDGVRDKGSAAPPAKVPKPGAKKRGRPRKNP